MEDIASRIRNDWLRYRKHANHVNDWLNHDEIMKAKTASGIRMTDQSAPVPDPLPTIDDTISRFFTPPKAFDTDQRAAITTVLGTV